MASRPADVAIVGGGPAGGAAALSLRAHAPSLSVTLIEASAYDSPRLGESLPPPARRLLEHLQVWEAFRRQGHREVCGTVAVWGAAAPRDNDFLYALHGRGWHLDRAAFDALLVDAAERRGARLLRRTRLRGAERRDGTWRLGLADGRALGARFVVDATGGAAVVARGQGAGFLASDRLVAVARFFAGHGGGEDPRTLVEAFADGWWYTAALPGGQRIVACMTDADLARRLRLREPSRWWGQLQGAARVAAAVGGAHPCGPLLVRAAPSRRLEPAAGDGWLAIGDAASIFDPLSSQGIAKALRSGIFASYAIADLLVAGDGRGIERYRRYVRDEFASYAEVRARVYREERRWPRSEFWRRRHSAVAAPLHVPGQVGEAPVLPG
jgi:flavin-dependent dehydrogenase